MLGKHENQKAYEKLIDYRIQMNDVFVAYKMLKEGYKAEDIRQAFFKFYKDSEHADYCIREALKRYKKHRVSENEILRNS